MEYIRQVIETENPGEQYDSFDTVYLANRKSNFKYWALGVLFALIAALFLPWTQNVRARGMVTTPRQEQRTQELNAIIGGRIVKWYVKEGDLVHKGDTILQLAEVKVDYLDPDLVPRTKEQLEAKKTALGNYKGKIQTIDQQVNYLREALQLKIRELENKILQQKAKISSDSMDMLAATKDYGFKQEQYRRQKVMYDSGVVSLISLEQRNQAVQDGLAKKTSAEIKYANSNQELHRLQLELNGERQQYLEKLAKATGEKFVAESQVATGIGEIAKLENLYTSYDIRNQLYYVVAPQDGQVIQAMKAGINETVKEGEKLVQIVPVYQQLAVELFIKPVDLPLVSPGQRVSFVFDGFPAIVFSGWPQSSFGTFYGRISVVESAVGANGLFRVLVVEDTSEKSWPQALRQGTGAMGIALLKDVPVWYELWRNINGFPPDYYLPEEQNKKSKDPSKS